VEASARRCVPVPEEPRAVLLRHQLGVQIFLIFGSMLTLAVLRSFHLLDRETAYAAFVIIYSLTAVIAGPVLRLVPESGGILMGGAIGFFSSLTFVRKIYRDQVGLEATDDVERRVAQGLATRKKISTPRQTQQGLKTPIADDVPVLPRCCVTFPL
jgi:hypothetical protein